jgi:homoserine dehydrogenase
MKRAPMARRQGPTYIRLMVRDKPGVIADVTAALRDEDVSLESMIQHGRAQVSAEGVAVVLTTHDAEEAAVQRALARIGALPSMIEKPNLIRIEAL